MLDWLRRDPRENPCVEVAGRQLPVVIRRLERARRLTMRLAPDGSEVRISMPRWGRSAEALAFAASRREWLARQLASRPEEVPLLSGGTLHYRGIALILDHDSALPRRPAVHGGALRVGGPETSLAPRISRWLQAEARSLLTQDLADYCGLAGVSVPALALSSARRRWGSCAPDGGIRINWRLVMAPDAVRRSVVAHEVAHLLHFDHSPAFHAALEALFEGSVPEANRWLKDHGPSLYVPFG